MLKTQLSLCDTLPLQWSILLHRTLLYWTGLWLCVSSHSSELYLVVFFSAEKLNLKASLLFTNWTPRNPVLCKKSMTLFRGTMPVTRHYKRHQHAQFCNHFKNDTAAKARFEHPHPHNDFLYSSARDAAFAFLSEGKLQQSRHVVHDLVFRFSDPFCRHRKNRQQKNSLLSFRFSNDQSRLKLWYNNANRAGKKSKKLSRSKKVRGTVSSSAL